MGPAYHFRGHYEDEAYMVMPLTVVVVRFRRIHATDVRRCMRRVQGETGCLLCSTSPAVPSRRRGRSRRREAISSEIMVDDGETHHLLEVHTSSGLTEDQ